MPAFNELYFTGTGWIIRDGDLYVSSIGDDIEGLGTPLDPYATINKAIQVASSGQKIVVGNGTYLEEVDALSKDILLYGDGYVFISGENILEKAFANFGANSIINGFRVVGFETAIDGTISALENCFIDESSIVNFGGQISYSIFKNNTLEATQAVNILNCTFITVTAGGVGNNNIISIYDSIIGNGSVFDLSSSITLNFDYCNQENGSQVKIDGNTYLSASAVNTTFGSFQTKGLTAASGFNNAIANDYSISSNSVLRNAGRFYKYIGAKGEARSFKRSTLTGSTLSAVSINNNRYELDEGFNEGSITTRPIDMGKVLTIGKINLFAEQIFEIPPLNAVVDATVFNRPPNVITFLMRYSNSPTLILSESYKEYLWGQIPTIDNTGKSNGDAEFDFSNQIGIDARYLQFQIVLKKADDSFNLVQEDGDCLLQENLGNIIWKY